MKSSSNNASASASVSVLWTARTVESFFEDRLEEGNRLFNLPEFGFRLPSAVCFALELDVLDVLARALERFLHLLGLPRGNDFVSRAMHQQHWYPDFACPSPWRERVDCRPVGFRIADRL